MKKVTDNQFTAPGWLLVLLMAWPFISSAQTPTSTRLSSTELQELVGPIALYPDDLLAIVLPASTYPLQLVQAQRFLDDLESDPALKPDESWDDSIVALINYPEALNLLNDDLDWTWRLGEAVVAQQAEVIDAVESFRDRAYAAGNLKSDEYQTISEDSGVIEITPVSDDVIYVPYYEPERVVVYQSRPAYYYYPDPYPVYNYPYPAGYAFNHAYFWGVTTAFTIGWYTDNLHIYHHSYHGHPYYGHSYRNHYWYRRPSIHVHNYHYNSYKGYSGYSQTHGDYWKPQSRNSFRSSDHRVTRNRNYSGSTKRVVRSERRSDIKFRDRPVSLPKRHDTTRLAQVRPSPKREHHSRPERTSPKQSRPTKNRENNPKAETVKNPRGERSKNRRSSSRSRH